MEKRLPFLFPSIVYSLCCWSKDLHPCVESGFGSARCMGYSLHVLGQQFPASPPCDFPCVSPQLPEPTSKCLVLAVAPGMSDFRPFQLTVPPLSTVRANPVDVVNERLKPLTFWSVGFWHVQHLVCFLTEHHLCAGGILTGLPFQRSSHPPLPRGHRSLPVILLLGPVVDCRPNTLPS